MKLYAAIVSIIAVVAVIFAVVLTRQQNHGPDSHAMSNPRSVAAPTEKPSALEHSVQQIASKFICACGECGEKPLEICRCSTALKELAFIRKALLQGRSEADVIAAVNREFGWMKPEFK